MLPQHPVNDDIRIETYWSNFKRFSVKFYISALVGIIKVTFSFRRMPTRFAWKDKLNKVRRVSISTICRELREGCVLFSPAFFESDN